MLNCLEDFEDFQRSWRFFENLEALEETERSSWRSKEYSLVVVFSPYKFFYRVTGGVQSDTDYFNDFPPYLNHNFVSLNLLNAVSAIIVSVPYFPNSLKIPKDLRQNLYIIQESLPSLIFFATICKDCQRFFAARLLKIFKNFKDLQRQVHMGRISVDNAFLLN